MTVTVSQDLKAQIRIDQFTYSLETAKRNVAQATAAITKRGAADWSAIDALVSASAHVEIYTSVVNFVTTVNDFALVPPVEMLAKVAKMSLNRVVNWNPGRSTSEGSNMLDLVGHALWVRIYETCTGF